MENALVAPVEGARYAYHKGKEIWYGYDAAFQEQVPSKKEFIKGLMDIDFKKIDDENYLSKK